MNSGYENVKGVTLLDTQQKAVVAGVVIGHQCGALECHRERGKREQDAAPAGTVVW